MVFALKNSCLSHCREMCLQMSYEIEWNTIMSTLEGTLGATKSENQERLHIIVKIEEDLKGYGRRWQREGVCKFF